MSVGWARKIHSDRVMTNGDHEGQISPNLSKIMDSFSCSPLNTSIGKHEKDYAEM